jgi:hypothetical protein
MGRSYYKLRPSDSDQGGAAMLLDYLNSKAYSWWDLVFVAVIALLIWMSLNFRIWLTFTHPGRKLKAKVRKRVADRRRAQLKHRLVG